MKSFKKMLTVPKGMGDVIGMTLRRSCIKESVSLRPIGFLLADGGNMLHSKDSILEDMLTLSTTLAKSYFNTNDKSELIEVVCDFSGSVRLSDIAANGGMTLVTEDKVLLNSIDNNLVQFKVAFRNANGNYSNQENRRFLMENLNNSAYVTFSSRHTAIESFMYNVKEEDDKDIINITYTVNNDDEQVVENTIHRLVEILSSIA